MSVSPSPRPPSWAIFCAAIDNYGDIGVCWRLARQLTREHGIALHLWIDDGEALLRFLHLDASASDQLQQHEGVWLHSWQPAQQAQETALLAHMAVVIEAFGCSLPLAVRQCMAQAACPPLWLNLEYLSAEDWVRDCHLLSSPQSIALPDGQQRLLDKRFFFPGFLDGTGGLIREQAILAQHAQWQSSLQRSRASLLLPHGLPPAWLDVVDCLWLSIFTYEGAALHSLLRALEEGALPTVCLVPQGRSLLSVAAYFDVPVPPAAGAVLTRGALRLVVLPFLSQADYDALLSVCDVNFVRGEDSFVRAQYAARTMIWQLYPQEDAAHLVKMEAFLALYADSSEASKDLQAFWRGWNQGEDCRELWHHLRPQLPTLQQQARRWQQKLADKPDLAAVLMHAYREHIAQSSTDGARF